MSPQPVRTIPIVEPTTEPLRRLEPDRLCPAQKGRVTKRVRRELGRGPIRVGGFHTEGN